MALECVKFKRDDAAVRTATGYAGAIIRDPADVRDLIYRPSLGSLPEKFLCAEVDPASPVLGGILAIRDQGERPTCIGENAEYSQTCNW